MGLDIHIMTEVELDISDNFNAHSLSREFCNFMCRRHVVEHTSELDQIGEITGVAISCIYVMELYPDELEIEMSLEYIESEAEKKNILAQAEKNKKKVTGNINIVLQTLNQLLDKLGKIDNLPSLLLPTDFDTLNSKYYFSDFTTDKREGYIDNNFGQDLRNFKRFVEDAKALGNETVWFVYG